MSLVQGRKVFDALSFLPLDHLARKKRIPQNTPFTEAVAERDNSRGI